MYYKMKAWSICVRLSLDKVCHLGLHVFLNVNMVCVCVRMRVGWGTAVPSCLVAKQAPYGLPVRVQLRSLARSQN